MVDNGEFLVEANDMAGVQLLIDNKLPVITGPSQYLQPGYPASAPPQRPQKRWVMPVELGREALAGILRHADLGR